MEVDTHDRNSEWTLNTLFIYFSAVIEANEQKNNQRFDDQQKAVDAALAAAEKAVKAALESAQKAVDKAESQEREWRKGSNEWRQAMDDREIKFLPRSEYKASHDALLDRITTNESRVQRSEGKSSGFAAGWGYLVAGVGLLLTLIAIFSFLKK